MSINCCKSYVGKQIIGLLPGGAEECWYLVYLDSNYFGYSNWTGWTLNGNDLITELTSICQAQSGNVAIRDGITNASELWAFYLGTSNTTYAAYDPANNETPIPFNEVAQCEACYQFEVPYGENIKGINVANIIEFLSITPVDDEAGLQTELELLFGTQVSVSSVWDGSNYIVTINNAWDPGAGISLVNSSGGEYIGSPGDCPITPPEPVSLFVLDLYPGATAAYGMRKLSSTYTGPAFRVRRSSDNTEQDIGFSGINVDVSALSFFVGANNGFITRWYDQTGQSREFGQLNASLQPRIVNAGVIDMANGIPSIFFGEATIKYMETFNAAEPAFDFTNTYSIYIAAKPANQAGDQVIFGKGTGLFGQTGYYISTGNSQSYLINNNSTTTPNFSALINNGSIALSCYGFNLSSGNGSSSFNGSIINNYTGLISARLNNLNPIIGVYQTNSNTNDFDGWFSEMIIYPIDQSANRTAIETNIKNYYSI